MLGSESEGFPAKFASASPVRRILPIGSTASYDRNFSDQPPEPDPDTRPRDRPAWRPDSASKLSPRIGLIILA
jgi:hypothetical protein